jgi:hypothetical protein
VQLVIPAPLHNTYTAKQQAWLLDVSGFISLVKARQVWSDKERQK